MTHSTRSDDSYKLVEPALVKSFADRHEGPVFQLGLSAAGRGALTSAGSRTRLWPLIPDLIVGLFVIINTLRLFRHAMWRDELQAFMLAAASSTPLDLYAKLQYEGHPGLWHLLLWAITRFTNDPIAMQVAQLSIALGIWLLIWRVSPFRPIEKLLLLLSYYLFWEYFVSSRSYALGVLLGFSFIALRLHRPTQRFWPWVLLGLLANTSVFATIWSIGLGAFFALRNRREWRPLLIGAMLYALLVALAIATMMPAPDARFNYSPTPSLPLSNFDKPLDFLVGAFCPLFPPFLPDALHWIGGPAAALASTTLGTHPCTFLLTEGNADNALLVLIILVAPILACFSIVRDLSRTTEFAAIYVGMLLFVQLWGLNSSPRHQGYLFIALVGTVWMWRSAILPSRRLAWVWVVLLVLNVMGGLTTLSAGLRPYSQSRNAATWLVRHHMENALLIGTRDATTSPIAGYLGRPLYYLECECFGTHVVWSQHRKRRLKRADVITRVARGMMAQNRSEAILLSSLPYGLGSQTLLPHLSFEPIKRFSSAIVADETYDIYRVRMRSAD